MISYSHCHHREQKAYLITSLHLLIQQLPAPVPPALLAAHIQLLASHHTSLGSGLLPAKANTPQKILRVARKHTAKSPTRASVWLARLGAERAFADQDEIESAWAEARKSVSGDGVQDVWLWGLEPSNRSRTRHDEPEDEVKLLEVRVRVITRCGGGNCHALGPDITDAVLPLRAPISSVYSICYMKASMSSGSRRRRSRCMSRS